MVRNLTIIITVLFLAKTTAQPNVYFSKQNKQAILDSIENIKYVNPHQAIQFIFEVIEKYPEDRPNKVVGSAYTSLGQIYHIKGLDNQALDYLSQAEEEFENLTGAPPPWLEIDIGNIYFGIGMYAESKKYYRKAFNYFQGKLSSAGLDLSKNSNNWTGLSVSSNNIALIEIELGNYELAELEYFKGLNYRRNNSKLESMAHSYISLSELNLKWERLDKVLLYCDSTQMVLKKFLNNSDDKNKRISKNVDNINFYSGLIQQHLGERMAKLNQESEALKYFKSAEIYFKSLPVDLTRLMAIFATVQSQFGNQTSALLTIDKGLTIAQDQELYMEQKQLLKQKIKLLSSMGDYKELENTTNILLALNQEKISIQNKDLFTNMTLKNNLRNKERELSKAATFRQQFIFMSIIIFMIFGVIILIFRYKNAMSKHQAVILSKDKKIAKVKLHSAEYELKYVTKSIMEKNDMLESIKKDVNYVSTFISDSNDLKQAVNPLKIKLDEVTADNKEWSKFQHTFGKAYPGFIEQFLKINKSLTVQDLRFSIYLRAGHATKEIAKLSGLSIRSIESRRHRLRKKLKLDKKTNLITFLMDIPVERKIH
jgi:DNA-binding NarL/FixJ family response regulator